MQVLSLGLEVETNIFILKMERQKVKGTRSEQCNCTHSSSSELLTAQHEPDPEILDSNANLVVEESSDETESDVSYSPSEESPAVSRTSQILGRCSTLKSCLKSRISSAKIVPLQLSSDSKRKYSGLELEESHTSLRTQSLPVIPTQTSETESENSAPSESESEETDLTSESDSGSGLPDSTSTETDQNDSDYESCTESSTISSESSEPSSDDNSEAGSSINNGVQRKQGHWRLEYKVRVPFDRRDVGWQNCSQERVEHETPLGGPNPLDRNAELRERYAQLLAEKQLRLEMLKKPDQPSRWENFTDSVRRFVRPEESPREIVASGRKVVFTWWGLNKAKSSQPPIRTNKAVTEEETSYRPSNHSNIIFNEFRYPPARPAPMDCRRNIRMFFSFKWRRFKNLCSKEN